MVSPHAKALKDLHVSCDWLKFRCVFPDVLPPALSGGKHLIVDPDGVLEADISRWFEHRPSSDTSVRLRTYGNVLEFDGNVARLGNPHNFEGPSVAKCFAKAQDVCRSLGLPQPLPWGTANRTQKDDASILLGTHFRRVDLNTKMLVSRPLADRYMAWLGTLPVGNKVSAVGNFGPTWAMGSRYWSAKTYRKDLETSRKRGESLDERRAALRDYFGSDDACVCLEIGLKGMWLADNDAWGPQHWTDPEHDKVVFLRFFHRQLEHQGGASVDEFALLPGRLAAWAVLWRDGADLREHMSQATWYRVRKELLAFGLDIKVPCDVSRLRHRVEVIEARPAPSRVRLAVA